MQLLQQRCTHFLVIKHKHHLSLLLFIYYNLYKTPSVMNRRTAPLFTMLSVIDESCCPYITSGLLLLTKILPNIYAPIDYLQQMVFTLGCCSKVAISKIQLVILVFCVREKCNFSSRPACGQSNRVTIDCRRKVMERGESHIVSRANIL